MTISEKTGAGYNSGLRGPEHTSHNLHDDFLAGLPVPKSVTGSFGGLLPAETWQEPMQRGYELDPNKELVSNGNAVPLITTLSYTDLNLISTQALPPNENDLISLLDQHVEKAKEEARFEMRASIRDNVRNLPIERHAELFADFDEAVKRKDIGYMADTILNWATGGNGYKRAGMPVNRLARRLGGKYKDSPVWHGVSAIMKEEREKSSE